MYNQRAIPSIESHGMRHDKLNIIGYQCKQILIYLCRGPKVYPTHTQSGHTAHNLTSFSTIFLSFQLVMVPRVRMVSPEPDHTQTHQHTYRHRLEYTLSDVDPK